ncbi:hypothetical protein H0H93_006867 [Arthromyces matolae]|nr:hypothetical protein H0H93_006867 [Arthromyces matolae]
MDLALAIEKKRMEPVELRNFAFKLFEDVEAIKAAYHLAPNRNFVAIREQQISAVKQLGINVHTEKSTLKNQLTKLRIGERNVRKWMNQLIKAERGQTPANALADYKWSLLRPLQDYARILDIVEVCEVALNNLEEHAAAGLKPGMNQFDEYIDHLVNGQPVQS